MQLKTSQNYAFFCYKNFELKHTIVYNMVFLIIINNNNHSSNFNGHSNNIIL